MVPGEALLTCKVMFDKQLRACTYLMKFFLADMKEWLVSLPKIHCGNSKYTGSALSQDVFFNC